jgi:hypothetical protein
MPPLAYFGIESTGVTLVVDLLILFALLLYATLVYWTYVDSRRRIVDPMLTGLATAVSLIPFVGTLLYLIVRPTESLEDAHERELELETTKLRLHELESSLCPHCDYPITPDYVRCPSCLRKLKDQCTSCSRPLDRAWTICPFCETEVSSSRTAGRRTGKRGARGRQPLQSDAGREPKPPTRPPAPERDRQPPAPAGTRDSSGRREPQPASARAEREDARAERAHARAEREDAATERAGARADGRSGGRTQPAGASGQSSGI